MWLIWKIESILGSLIKKFKFFGILIIFLIFMLKLCFNREK